MTPGKSQLSPLTIRKNSLNQRPLSLYFQELWSFSYKNPLRSDVLLAVQFPLRRGWKHSAYLGNCPALCMQWIIWAVCKQLLLFHPSDSEVPSGLGCSSFLRSWLLDSGVLICTAAAQGAWCLFLILLVAEERRVRLLRHRVFYKLPPSRHCIKLFIPGGPGTSMREAGTAPGPAATSCLCPSFHTSQDSQDAPKTLHFADFVSVHWCCI